MTTPRHASSSPRRKRQTGRAPTYLVCAAALGLAGCAALFAPRPVAWDYFLLTSLPAPDASVAPAAPELVVGLGPITLPSYLDRIQIVRREATNQLSFNDRERWGQPLEDGFARVLADDLVTLLGSKTVFRPPWRARDTLDAIVEIDVTRFEVVTASRRAELRARWRIRDARTKKFVADGAAELDRPLADESTTAGVAAMSETIGDLARELATALARQHAAAAPAGGGGPAT